jgi:hypothetical protein
MEDIPSFKSSAEEIEFWKSKAESFFVQYKDVKEEFQEFQVLICAEIYIEKKYNLKNIVNSRRDLENLNKN